MAHHEIPATYENMVWGYFDAATPPVLTVASGDTVRLHAFPAGGPATLHPDPSRVVPAYREAIEKLERGGPHFVTGPVYVEGAMPGDVLQIDILELVVNMDHGHMSIMPNLGAAPEVFTDYETIHPDVDLDRGVMIFPWGTEIPLDPFFGVIAVAPPASWGRHPSPVPRAFGGNMDNKELRPGTTLYLPVFNEGALFTAGDGHGVQGDGEVCITALETALTGTFRLTVRKDLSYRKPFAENETHLISIGINEDLDDAAKEAVLEMVDRICERTSLTPNQAYMLCSVAADLRVTQIVDGNKGIHAMLAKKYL